MFVSAQGEENLVVAPNAVRTIVHCLCDTMVDGKDAGLTLDVGKASEVPGIEFHVDADFVGLWRVENDADPVSSKSRTGFVIFVGN